MAPKFFTRHVLIVGDVDWQELTNHLFLKASQDLTVRLSRDAGGVYVRIRTVRPLLKSDFKKLMKQFPGITSIYDNERESFSGSGKATMYYKPGPVESEQIAKLAERLKSETERGWKLER